MTKHLPLEILKLVPVHQVKSKWNSNSQNLVLRAARQSTKAVVRALLLRFGLVTTKANVTNIPQKVRWCKRVVKRKPTKRISLRLCWNHTSQPAPALRSHANRSSL